MLILLLLMALILAVALWSYSYVWRGLNRRVIAAVKVVDPMITLGPYAMVAWVGLMGVIATNMWATGVLHTVLTIILWVIVAGTLGWAGFWLLMHCLGGQTPGKRPCGGVRPSQLSSRGVTFPACLHTWVAARASCPWSTRT